MNAVLQAALRGCIIVCLCSSTVAHAQELDNLVAEYTYEVEENTRALIPEGLAPEDIPFNDLEKLTPRSSISTIREGVDNQNGYYFEVKYLEQTIDEDWMELAYHTISTPIFDIGYDKEGNLMYRDSVKGTELEASEQFRSHISENGYSPVLTMFPTIQQLQESGLGVVSLVENEDNFELIFPDGIKITVNPVQLVIVTELNLEGKTQVRSVKYTYLDPYGFVPLQESELIFGNTDEPTVKYLTTRSYSNHQIIDPENRIKKASDLTHIAVSPVPISDQFTIRLVGLPDEKMEFVQVFDYMGNEVFSTPVAGEAEVRLSSDGYPSGALIVRVTTNRSTHSTVITN